MAMIGIDLGPKVPPLARFDEQITRFKKLKDSVANMKTSSDIHWLRVNALPVKIQLAQFIVKWEEQYSKYLLDYVEGRIDQLTQFIDKVMTGLTAPKDEDGEADEKMLYFEIQK
jgi:hypothetical protein